MKDLQLCCLEQLAIGVSPHIGPDNLSRIALEHFGNKRDIDTVDLHRTARRVFSAPVFPQSGTNVDSGVIGKFERSRRDRTGDNTI